MKHFSNRTVFFLACALISIAPVDAFAGGDKAGEAQPPPPAWMEIPPAPPLTPEEALKTFKLQPGFHMELVAADPLIHDPIAIAFDPDGRIYVVEYRGYMPNADGRGEDAPVGSIALLEDSKGDGSMDKRTEFLDKLVLPRAINLSNGGVIVAEPPRLLFCKDKTGGGVASTRGVLPYEYAQAGNPEHTANGLMNGLDNWIYSANYGYRFRWRNNRLIRDDSTQKGQWGISQDDYGRLFFNSNSNLLFADFVPSHYIFRNSAYSLANKADMNALGINVEIVKDQRVYSSRVNPGVNRGYQPNALRPDGRLDKVTATCGVGVYRGDQFPPEYKGNVFIPEPSANLIKRMIITEQDGFALTGQSAYDKDEFLTSTDERFRPVNVYTAPDGTLYIVDLYRGILQHRIYLTTYLKQQSIERQLDKFNGMGRIYRVVADGRKPGPKPQLSKATPAELVQYLSHANGWWRDTAQRLLIESKDDAVVPALRKLASTPEPEGALGRLHALWTLEGLNAIDAPTIISALEDPRPKIQSNALRVAETILKAPSLEAGETQPKPFTPPLDVLEEIKKLAEKNADAGVRLQLVFTLSEVAHPLAVEIVGKILNDHIDNPAVRGAAISGMAGRELEYIEEACSKPAWSAASPGKEKFIQVLASCVMKRRIGERIEKLIDLAGAQKETWRQAKILAGLTESAPKNGVRVKLPVEPAALSKLLNSSDAAVNVSAKLLDAAIKWPNRAGMPPEPPPPTGEHLASFERGREVYKLCAECHHPQGWGIEGKAPPLAGSDWAQGPEARTVRMILHGMVGPKKLGSGETYNKNGTLEMPEMGKVLNDRQIADVLTYIRREWENFAPQVRVESVSKIRDMEKTHEGPWNEKDLNALVPNQPAPKKDNKKKIDDAARA